MDERNRERNQRQNNEERNREVKNVEFADERIDFADNEDDTNRFERNNRKNKNNR